MLIGGYEFDSIWGMPDAKLLSGFDVVKQFQTALHDGDYAKAASLYVVDERETEFLLEMGIDPKNLAGSFETLCADQAIFCHPVKSWC